jgi:tetratricopeptide (TPR) repeat protein/tRNA A-37 threonylcarbamoyl transferase component Bud32
MPVQPDRWREIEAVFEAVQERPADQQAAYLDQACGGDAELRQEVESLLKAASDTRFLESSPLGATDPTDDAGVTEQDLLERLQRGLGTVYRVERELGGGGMARIFVATESALRRKVVLKVLAPELAAGLNADRFHREVRLAASLQHPHVVPLHAAGEAEGLLYYTMPFVAGESLRHRLEREGPLPVPEVVRLLREVADALGFAHRRGIVHRDLKPANILLSEGHALVADFGIAKALVASSTTTATSDTFTTSTLTSPGLVVGTPAYMAPEQAASDRASDHRADLYALGCLAYELLTGRPPFVATSARGLFTAHLIETPTPVTAHRADVPPPLDQLILHLLAKDPAQRPQTAKAVVEILDAASAELARPVVPPPSSAATVAVAPERAAVAPGRRKPPVRAALAVALAVGGAAIGYATFRRLRPAIPTLLSTGVLKEREPLLVAEFENRTPDSLVGPAVTDAFRLDLGSSPVVTVLPPTKVSDALERMRRPPDTRLDAALARELAVREGIKAVLTGQVARLGGGFLLSAELVSPESGDVLAAYRETAPDSTQVIAAIDRLSSRLRARIGESLRSLRNEPLLTQVTTSSLAALHKYIEGQVAGDVSGDYVRAVALLQEAVALDSGFATAWRTLGAFQDRLGNREQGVAALTKAMQHADRLTELEREHTRAIYYYAVTGEYEQAVAIYRDLARRYPHDSLAANNLAVAYYVLHQNVLAESIWRARLDTIHPWTPGGQLNLATGLVALGRRAEAARMVEQAGRLFPDAGGVGWYRERLAFTADDYTTADSLGRELLQRYGDTPWDKAADNRDLAGIALARGRLTEAERYLRAAMAVNADAGQAPEYLREAAFLGYVDIWFRGHPALGLRTIEAALHQYPLQSIKPLERPYLILAVAYASAGRPEQARSLLSEYEATVDPVLRRIDEPTRRWAWGHVAMAEGRLADAIAQFQAYAPAPRGCLPCGQTALAQAYDRSGNTDSSIAVYERYLATPSLYRLDEKITLADDPTQLAPACKRLGELYEARGDTARARRQYTRFVKLWRDADPELRPAVVEVQQRLQHLGGEEAAAPAQSP